MTFMLCSCASGIILLLDLSLDLPLWAVLGHSWFVVLSRESLVPLGSVGCMVGCLPVSSTGVVLI